MQALVSNDQCKDWLVMINARTG